MPESKGRQFRRLLKEEPYLFTGGVYEPLGAQIAERVGMKSIYLSGYSMALHNGWPDMGFLTQTEVARIASMVASATTLPIIADADDGYGNALSTMRTVQSGPLPMIKRSPAPTENVRPARGPVLKASVQRGFMRRPGGFPAATWSHRPAGRSRRRAAAAR